VLQATGSGSRGIISHTKAFPASGDCALTRQEMRT
jgi:hypothetical protein